MSNNKLHDQQLQHQLHHRMRNQLERTAPHVNNEIIYKELSYAVVGAAIEVHRYLGPGQLEATYDFRVVRFR